MAWDVCFIALPIEIHLTFKVTIKFYFFIKVFSNLTIKEELRSLSL